MEHDGLIYVRTGPTTWKVKRIRRNSHVRVVLSDRNGNPTGTWVEAQARLLDGEERERALQFFKKEYGALGYTMVGLVGRMRGERNMTAVISIKLGEVGTSAPSK